MADFDPFDDVNVEVIFKGQTYIWDGENWLDSDYMHPPEEIILQLNKKLEPTLMSQPIDRLSKMQLLWKAMAAREAKMIQYAEYCLDHLLRLFPADPAAMKVLIAIKRELGKPGDAIEIADSLTFAQKVNVGAPLAAALADEGRYEEAFKLICKVVGKQQSGPAFAVYKRIEKEAPDVVSRIRGQKG